MLRKGFQGLMLSIFLRDHTEAGPLSSDIAFPPLRVSRGLVLPFVRVRGSVLSRPYSDGCRARVRIFVPSSVRSAEMSRAGCPF